MGVLTSFLVLITTTLLFSLIDYQTNQNQMISSYAATADFFGHKCQKALEYCDQNEASIALSWANMYAEIELAVLYDQQGQEFAWYKGTHLEAPTFRSVQDLNRTFDGDHNLTLIQPITSTAEEIAGYLYLKINAGRLQQRLKEQGIVAILLLVCSLPLAGLIASLLQKTISSPIVELVEKVTQVANSGDYTCRTTTDATDELRELSNAVNSLLHATEERTKQLQVKSQEAMEASIAKSAFLANMSHEIRTPLNCIIGYSDLLQRGWDESPQERNEMLRSICTCGNHLLHIINDILDLSKIESGQVELELRSVSPHSILSDVISLFRVQFAETDVTLEYRWEGMVPDTITTDGQRLRQIVINLLGNAKKFTSIGAVRIIARVNSDTLPETLEIELIDTGVGIAVEKQAKIFDPFVQADQSISRCFGGTGLGLSISRKLARMMGGDLTVQSLVGVGSIFKLTIATGDLTFVKQRSLDMLGDIVPNESISGQANEEQERMDGIKVLVVDDSEANRRLLAFYLRRLGVSITEASDGKQACNVALGNQAFDLILLDMQTPVMDGYAAVHLMRAKGLKTPILALTANAMKEDREKCLNAGCDDYLTKPIAVNVLVSHLKKFVKNVDRSNSESLEGVPIRSTLPIEEPELARIVIDFIPVFKETINRLADAVEHRELQEALDETHRIKGTAGSAGFDCFTELTDRMTEALKARNWTDADQVMFTIQNNAKRIETPARPILDLSMPEFGVSSDR